MAAKRETYRVEVDGVVRDLRLFKVPSGVKIAILNNSYLGMVRQWQELFYDKRYASTVMEITPDFVKLAEAYGAVGLRATKKSEVVPVIEKALATKKRRHHGFLHRPRGECLPDGAGRQGHDRDAARLIRRIYDNRQDFHNPSRLQDNNETHLIRSSSK